MSAPAHSTGRRRRSVPGGLAWWAALTAIGISWSVHNARAADAAPSASETFLIGNVVFALLHEFGHAIIRDFDVPILGLEEESADTIAAVALIQLDRQHPDTGFGSLLGVTALAQAYVWKTGLERTHGQVTLWAQHGLSAQRYARLVCLLYGSDTERYGWVAAQTGMEEIRAETCEDEWKMAERAVRWVRETYGIPPGERASRPVASVSVDYGRPRDAKETRLQELLQHRAILEKIGHLAEASFAFPGPIKLKLGHCRVPNAYWDDEYREVVLCYELMEAIEKYAEQPEVTKLVERFRARP
jgi:hypothetical protein